MISLTQKRIEVSLLPVCLITKLTHSLFGFYLSNQSVCPTEDHTGQHLNVNDVQTLINSKPNAVHFEDQTDSITLKCN